MRFLRVLVLVAAATVLIPKIALAANDRQEITFKLYRGYTIIVQGSIGALRNCNLLIDTGAVPSVLDRRVAKKLRLVGRPDEVSVFSQSISGRAASDAAGPD